MEFIPAHTGDFEATLSGVVLTFNAVVAYFSRITIVEASNFDASMRSVVSTLDSCKSHQLPTQDQTRHGFPYLPTG